MNKPAAAPAAAQASEPNPTGTRCPIFYCGDNGTQLTGIRGDHASTVRSVALPSGETVELR